MWLVQLFIAANNKAFSHEWHLWNKIGRCSFGGCRPGIFQWTTDAFGKFGEYLLQQCNALDGINAFFSVTFDDATKMEDVPRSVKAQWWANARIPYLSWKPSRKKRMKKFQTQTPKLVPALAQAWHLGTNLHDQPPTSFQGEEWIQTGRSFY